MISRVPRITRYLAHSLWVQHSCGQIYDKSSYSEELVIRVVRVVMASIFLIS